MANVSERPGIVVFAGPTLRPEDRPCLPRAIYLPPAEQGSFVDAVRTHDPQAVVLIDGSFGRVPAVRHKEILWTLAQGISVFGAGSMGALRAAELADHGMVGFGLVYRWYRLAPLIDDDEVAVAMTPPELGAEPLGEALVNIRLTLRRCERGGVIGQDLRRGLESIAQSTYFVDRSYENLLAKARIVLPADQIARLDDLERWLPSQMMDQKRVDALGLLRRLGDGSGWRERAREPHPFVLTEAWAYDLADSGDPRDEQEPDGHPQVR